MTTYLPCLPRFPEEFRYGFIVEVRSQDRLNGNLKHVIFRYEFTWPKMKDRIKCSTRTRKFSRLKNSKV